MNEKELSVHAGIMREWAAFGGEGVGREKQVRGMSLLYGTGERQALS